MNYRRGFRRIAMLVGIPWVAGWLCLSFWFHVQEGSEQAAFERAYAAATAPQESDAWQEQFSNAGGEIALANVRRLEERRNTAALFAVCPPVAIWLVLIASRWIIRGFRNDPAEQIPERLDQAA